MFRKHTNHQKLSKETWKKHMKFTEKSRAKRGLRVWGEQVHPNHVEIIFFILTCFWAWNMLNYTLTHFHTEFHADSCTWYVFFMSFRDVSASTVFSPSDSVNGHMTKMMITFDLEDFRSCSGESFSPGNHPESISWVKTMIFNDAWPLSAKTCFFKIWIFEFQKNR